MEENNSAANEKAKREKVRLKGARLVKINAVPFTGESLYLSDMLFFSSVKEEKWLNYMAQQGYALTERRLKGYVFMSDKRAAQSYWSVCSLGSPPCSEESEAYIEKRADRGDILVCTSLNFAYFKTPKTGAEDGRLEDALSKRQSLKGLFLFNLFMLLVWLGLTVYHVFHWVYFNAAAVSAVQKTSFLWKNFGFFSPWLGGHPTTPLITLFFILTLVFIPLTAFFLDAYMASRALVKELSVK